MKLLSMTDFILEQNNIYYNNYDVLLSSIIQYAKFLKQPLKLEMFKGDDSIFIFHCAFDVFTESDMEDSIIEDLLSDDFDSYILNDSAIKRIFGKAIS
jgi:hypothetical protein